MFALLKNDGEQELFQYMLEMTPTKVETGIIEFTDLLAVPVVISIIYFGSDAKDIAETPASLAPSITLIIVSATAFSSA